VTISLGERIRRVRAHLRKDQAEFAEILGSQQTSVSRYERNKVVPGIAILSKLHDLAPPEDKPAFADELRKQIGTGIIETLGIESAELQGVTVKESIEELRPMIAGMAEIQEWNAMIASGRKDKAGLLWATSTLAEDHQIDESLIEILILCVQYRKQEGVESVFRAAAAFLRERLAQRFGETEDHGPEAKTAPAGTALKD
jgi:transcriptional regulator with XRE-family HTH domain